ncbi:Peroxiredoxin [Chitinophaga costaii]|uniref:Peroxiredoxin n=1 Tax=Chitinophaga costaii TaxID=1335309 RepID=A0A1C4EZ53_9BACT|nr:TlpA disulfide reductase family protein [Chitinophaga costaii]PUZ21531.1 AhpC/TSA family protein [Chitinophaga costaii]SCC48880.1 Peroxiredoxin [Chitinophaga costaii]
MTIRKIGWAALCLLTLPAMAQQQPNFTLKGTLTNMPHAYTKLYLLYDSTFVPKQADSAVVQDGKFQFSGYIPAAMNVSIVAQKVAQNAGISVNASERMIFMLGKGNTSLTANGSLGQFTLSGPGAKANQDYHTAIAATLLVTDSIKKITEQPDYKTNRALQTTVMYRISNLFKPMNDEMIAFVKSHPASPASPAMVYGIASSPFTTTQLTDTLLALLPAASLPTVKNAVATIYTKHAQEQAEKEAAASKTAPGTPAIDFTLNDIDGHPVSLDSYKGQYVLIDFWASWCGPCRAENPTVRKAFESFKDKGFTVLGVSLDVASQKDKWMQAVEKDGLPWKQVSDGKGWNSDVAALYGVKSIPQNFLISPDGKIIARNLRGAALEEKLATILH